jgi:hypothetical protein
MTTYLQELCRCNLPSTSHFLKPEMITHHNYNPENKNSFFTQTHIKI